MKTTQAPVSLSLLTTLLPLVFALLLILAFTS
ncbi:MAG: hypothetical protein QOF21_2435 [Actinomycetota bacterium]|jgi:hypothetical protein